MLVWARTVLTWDVSLLLWRLRAGGPEGVRSEHQTGCTHRADSPRSGPVVFAPHRSGRTGASPDPDAPGLVFCAHGGVDVPLPDRSVPARTDVGMRTVLTNELDERERTCGVVRGGSQALGLTSCQVDPGGPGGPLGFIDGSYTAVYYVESGLGLRS